jgi:hypothetical protein
MADSVETFEDCEEANPYAMAKKLILGNLNETKLSMMYRILHHDGLGDQRPSAMMMKHAVLDVSVGVTSPVTSSWQFS